MKAPKSDDLEDWMEGFLSKTDSLEEYDAAMIRLAVKLASRVKKISSNEISKVQAGVQIRELTKIITGEE